VTVRATVAATALALGACAKAQPAALYEKIPVERRDIVVTAVGLGVVQPRLTFSVKSKAWGEILTEPVQSGDEVQRHEVVATIDPRIPSEKLAEAQAVVDQARAAVANADEALRRSDTLFQQHAIAEATHDSSKLADAVAHATLAAGEASLSTATDAMEDTHVRAPITGTVLEIDAPLGTVVSSPTLGGGTVILLVANLDTVQDSAMIAETDIGRIQAGMPVTITVDAYGNRMFGGVVRKVGPEAQIVSNVTEFPVFVDLPNPGHLLRPGMNSEVTIHTGQSRQALAVPDAALRTLQDVGSAAAILGLDPAAVTEQVAAEVAAGAAPGGGRAPAESTNAHTFVMPNGRTIVLPPGVTAAQIRAALATVRSGGQPTPAERALLAQVFRGSGRGPGPGQHHTTTSYVVFALRGGRPVPVYIRTGLNDQDYVEVQSGLTDRDTVLILPTASLVQAQEQLRQRFQNVTGGGLPGLRQSSGAPRSSP
jgi:HlyD family secretion protein